MRILWVTLLGAISATSVLAQIPDSTHRQLHIALAGQVTADSQPVGGATVAVRYVGGDTTLASAVTPPSGRFLVHLIAQGSRALVVSVTHPGLSYWSTQLHVATDSLVHLNVNMAGTATLLPAVQTVSARSAPDRNSGSGIPPGNSERIVDGLSGALPPNDEGNLGAMAALTPGVLATALGPSIAGLSATQNRVTLNGFTLPATAIPVDAEARVQVATSAYDPAQGGFSGANIGIELPAGASYSFRSGRITWDPGPLASSAGRLVPPSSEVSIGGGARGPLAGDKFNYNVAGQLTHHTATPPSVFVNGINALRAAGLTGDSVARFHNVLSSLEPGLVRGVGPGDGNSASWIGRLDRTPRARTTWHVVTFGNVSKTDGIGRTAWATPGTGGSSSAALGQAQYVYSMLNHANILFNWRLGVTGRSQTDEPISVLPAGLVDVATGSDSTGAALRTFRFGGSAQPATRLHGWTWESLNDAQWYVGQRHLLKVTAELKYDMVHAERVPNLGEVRYRSLADLAAAIPAWFQRTLTGQPGRGAMWSGFLALGDKWRASNRLNVQYGLRLEAARFAGPFPYAAPVAKLPGIATAHGPNAWYMSPRVGFTWIYGPTNGFDYGETEGSLGRLYTGPRRGMLRGGIGEFRGALDPSLITALAARGGTVSCTGSTVPVIDWVAMSVDPAAIPSTCANGSSGSALADSAAQIRVVSSRYRAPDSWRANLAWTTTFGPLVTSVEGLIALNLNQPGLRGGNFGGVPQFRIVDEANRPVFVSPASIDSGTGVLNAAASRRDSALGPVLIEGSDLRSAAHRLTLTFTPADADMDHLYWAASYSFAGSRSLERGYDGSTDGSPLDRTWAAGDRDVRHEIQLQLGWNFGHGIQASLVGTVRSGLPFSPLIDGDVNGDGFSNDRAFVFAPGSTADSTAGAGMQTLLALAPDRVRSCLLPQIGRIAARNSCRGPWAARLNARVDLLQVPIHRDGARMFVNLTNPLAGLDQLVHGSGHLRGWGGTPRVDPVLLHLTGFNPATKQYRYEVNANFGSAQLGRPMSDVPFQIAVGMNIPLGPTRDEQQVMHLLGPGRKGHPGPKIGATDLIRQYSVTVPDVYAALDAAANDLVLTANQRQRLSDAHRAYQAKVAPIWRKLAEYLAGLGDDYDVDEAVNRSHATTNQVWAVVREQRRVILGILTPAQWVAAPKGVHLLLSPGTEPPVRVFIK